MFAGSCGGAKISQTANALPAPLAHAQVLSDADPEGRKHCVRLLRSFEYRSHVCLVFEPMVRGRAFGLGSTSKAVFEARRASTTCSSLTVPPPPPCRT